jgi:hypothetical protein
MKQRWEDPEINIATSLENSEPLNEPITHNSWVVKRWRLKVVILIDIYHCFKDYGRGRTRKCTDVNCERATIITSWDLSQPRTLFDTCTVWAYGWYVHIREREKIK